MKKNFLPIVCAVFLLIAMTVQFFVSYRRDFLFEMYDMHEATEEITERSFGAEDGQWLNAQINEKIVNDQMVNVPDSHYGTLKAPVVLRPADSSIYKVIEDNHVIIIKNNEKYDVTGKKL